MVEAAAWTNRLPHEGTLEVTLVPSAKERFAESRDTLEASLSLPGFRRGAAHFPQAYVAVKWAKRVEVLIQFLAHEAVTLLKPHLGAERGVPTSAGEWGTDLLSPMPEVVAHTNPLSPDTPLTIILRLSLQPSPPDPLQSDTVWPPDPALEAMRQASDGAKGEPAPPQATPLAPYPGAPTAPAPAAAPQSPPPPPGMPVAVGPGLAPLPAPPTHPLPPTPQLPDPGGF